MIELDDCKLVGGYCTLDSLSNEFSHTQGLEEALYVHGQQGKQFCDGIVAS